MNRKSPVKKPVKSPRFSRKKAEAVIMEQAPNVTPKDLEKVLDKTEDIKKKFERSGPLGKFIGDFKLLVAIIRDYWKGNYKKAPFWTIAAIVVALLYVLNPLDLIPDVLPFVGQIDDAAVIGACLLMVRQDLHNYRKWREKA